MRNASFLALFLAATVAANAQARPRRPNIIFILTDDQGYGDASCHGHPLLKTPYIDRLHDEGVRFDRFYVSPSCSPTRAALMTGMHEFRNGITHTIQPREHLWKGATILPQLLKTEGYQTGFVGKWHLGGGPGLSPNQRGFDWTSTNQGGSHVHFNPDIIRNGKRMKRTGFREDLFFDEAMAFVDESRHQPFFCYLATYSPHAPLDAPEEFIAPFRGKCTDDQAAYLGMIANIDYNIGRLMAFLEKRGLDKNTIVMLMNDNGITEGLDVYNAGMRGCKCTIWEGGTRAMSFWHWPAQWKPHTVKNLTAHIDVLPTLCELAGVDIPTKLQSELEGFSLVPLLESATPLAWHQDRLLFQHVARWPNGMAREHKHAMCAVRQNSHVLLRSRPCDSPACTPAVKGNQCNALRLVEQGRTAMNYTAADARFHWGVSPAKGWALFDVETDPACRKNLASRHPELAQSLAAAYDRWWDAIYPDMAARTGDTTERADTAKTAAPPAPAASPAATPAFEADPAKERLFRTMDRDRDGKATREEYLGHFRRAFRAMDKNGDNVLGPNEFTHTAFKAADRDKDGQVTPAEHDAMRAGHFKTFDADQDGSLTLQEMAAKRPPSARDDIVRP